MVVQELLYTQRMILLITILIQKELIIIKLG